MTSQPPFTEIAPDGSIVEVFSVTEFASQCLCTLPKGKTSIAVRHRTVEELWYVLEGYGEIDRGGELALLEPGTKLTIHRGTIFQFRSTAKTLKIHITTLPAWPGQDEAEIMDPTRWSTKQ